MAPMIALEKKPDTLHICYFYKIWTLFLSELSICQRITTTNQDKLLQTIISLCKELLSKIYSLVVFISTDVLHDKYNLQIYTSGNLDRSLTNNL